MSEGIILTLSPEAADRFAELVADKLAARLSPPPEPYLDVDQAAEYLACGKRRIYDLVERGELVSYRNGKRYLFKRQDLDSYASGEHPRPTTPA